MVRASVRANALASSEEDRKAIAGIRDRLVRLGWVVADFSDEYTEHLSAFKSYDWDLCQTFKETA